MMIIIIIISCFGFSSLLHMCESWAERLLKRSEMMRPHPFCIGQAQAKQLGAIVRVDQ